MKKILVDVSPALISALVANKTNLQANLNDDMNLVSRYMKKSSLLVIRSIKRDEYSRMSSRIRLINQNHPKYSDVKLRMKSIIKKRDGKKPILFDIFIYYGV